MIDQDRYADALIKLRAVFTDGEALAIHKILKEDIKTDLAFSKGLERVLSGEPVQQVVGYTTFLGCRIELSPQVLIPRPETEEFVELILIRNPQLETRRLLDIGTGSGCIPIAIASKKPKWKVFSCDVSVNALKMAVRNIRINNVIVDLIRHDILTEDHWILPRQLDLLVSNPPYVLKSESAEMTKEVLEHEPHLALFVEDKDPLIFYRTIAELGKDCLRKGGQVYFECNAKYAKDVAGLLEGSGYNSVLVHKDLSGKDRFVSAIYS